MKFIEIVSTLCSVPNVQSQLTLKIKQDKLKQTNSTRQNRNFSKQIAHDKNRQARSAALLACGTIQIRFTVPNRAAN